MHRGCITHSLLGNPFQGPTDSITVHTVLCYLENVRRFGILRKCLNF